MEKTRNQEFNAKSLIGGEESINDLREKEFNGTRLSAKEQDAINNYDRWRIHVLGAQETEEGFHSKYIEMQALANLSRFQEFLKDKYITE